MYELTQMYILGDIKPTHSYYKARFFLNLSMWYCCQAITLNHLTVLNQSPFIFQSISTFLCLKFIALAVANMWGKPATVKIYITNIFFQDKYRKKYYVCVWDTEIH